MSPLDQIRQVFDQLGKSAPENPSTSIIDSGHVDSMFILELINALEDHFDLFFEEDDLALENFATLEKIEGMIKKRSGGEPE